jgi:hypothetical protein
MNFLGISNLVKRPYNLEWREYMYLQAADMFTTRHPYMFGKRSQETIARLLAMILVKQEQVKSCTPSDLN